MRKKRKKMPRKSDKKTPLKLPKRRRSVRKKSRNRRKSRPSEMRSRRKKKGSTKDLQVEAAPLHRPSGGMVDTQVLGTCVARREGSSPFLGIL